MADPAEIERLESRLREDMRRIDDEAKQTRHAIRGDIQKILIELATLKNDKWLMRALITLTAALATFMLSNIAKLLG